MIGAISREHREETSDLIANQKTGFEEGIEEEEEEERIERLASNLGNVLETLVAPSSDWETRKCGFFLLEGRYKGGDGSFVLYIFCHNS